MKDIGSTLYDNRYTVSVMVAAFVLVALGVLAVTMPESNQMRRSWH